MNKEKFRKKAVMLLFFICVHCAALTKISWTSEYERESRKKFEFGIGLSLNIPFIESSYTNQYPLQLEYGGGSGAASQVLRLNGNKNSGFNATLNYFLKKNFGVQILVDYFKSAIDGKNSPYDISLQYTAQQLPDYIPRQFNYERSLEWPDTEGYIKQLILSFNGIFRFITTNCMIAGFSGGISYFSFQGEASSLGYSTFWLGGQSVLFSEHSRLKFSLEPTRKIGFNAGLEMNMCLYENILFTVDFRYFYSPPSLSKIRLLEIVNKDEIIREKPIKEMEENMDLNPLKMGPSFACMRFVLKYQF